MSALSTNLPSLKNSKAYPREKLSEIIPKNLCEEDITS